MCDSGCIAANEKGNVLFVGVVECAGEVVTVGEDDAGGGRC